jgi:hypothetical protein
VIPSTAAGLLALLGCIAPGLVFQLRRERFTPPAQESILRETSRIALTSLLFTTAATAVAVIASRWWESIPDVGRWLREGRPYLIEHYLGISGFLLAIVIMSCAMAAAGEWVTRSDVHGNLSEQSIWFTTFRNDKPQGTKRIQLWVVTEDGTQFRGALRHFTPEVAVENREIALGGSALKRLSPGAKATEWERLDAFDAVLIPGADI